MRFPVVCVLSAGLCISGFGSPAKLQPTPSSRPTRVKHRHHHVNYARTESFLFGLMALYVLALPCGIVAWILYWAFKNEAGQGLRHDETDKR